MNETTSQAAEVAKIIANARNASAGDPRPRLGLMIRAAAELARSRGLAQRAAEEPGHEYAQAWRLNSEIARTAAAEMQAIAEQMPEPPAPLPGRVHLPHDWDTWRAIEAGHAEPDEYRAHVIEAMREAKAAGLYYNRETGPRCAAILAERWGYPDAREGADPAADFATVRAFGSHCYSAGRVLDARQRREALREAANKLHVGPIAGRLVTARGENITSARIVRIEHTGEVVEIIGKRGRADVTWKPNALGALEAIEGGRKWAEKHGRKPAGASIFDAAA